ncbi:hypothetical protein GGI07_003303 [Coemansia sp. Benny D115]|nr:hypothetical protein GGI07_003303 [Coemansia sp. Benny D115]
MDQDLWAEAVTTILTTLESAFLGENASPINNTTASSSRYKADSKKHARRATSDTMSDIELSGSPVKRRRESIDGTYSDNGEIAKHTAKSRKLSSALSRQFARSLSVSNGSAVEPVAQPDGDAMVEDDAIDNSRVSPYALSVSSSSSSLSSISPWPSTRASSDFMTSDTAAEYGGNLADNTPTDRVFVFPSAARSQKAREKASTNSNTHLIPFPQQPSSRCSMDMDSSDGNSIFSQSRFPVADGGGSNSNSNSNSGGGGVVHSVANYDVFSKLLAQTPIRGDLTEESVHAEVHRWAMEQSIKTEEPPNVLIASLESKISRLRELIPQISKQMASTHKSTSLSGDNLHEFYQAGCEVAAIGEWLKVRQFPLLSVFFSSLAQILPQLQRYIQASLIIGDMYRLLSWSPEFSLSLSDISNEYEELTN